jgi:cytochrome c oxidase subunit 2
MVVLMRRLTTWSVVALAVAMTCVTAGHAQSPQPRVILITAERFTFTPSEIVVDAGEEIEFRLKSDDTAHGFRIAGTPLSLVIPKRGHGEASAMFHANKAGRYAFECTRMCGAGHNFMRGVLVVRDRHRSKTGS